jgi:predicted nucleotidyltransferase
MRLSEWTCKAITGSVANLAPDSDCYLFGSRANDESRGGDIDVLLLTQEKLPLSLLRRIRRLILNQIGEQKLDIVNFTRESTHPFKVVALNNAVKL